ncbi:hypothetical protein D3C79_732260 [compost metagenome]
MEDQPQDNRRDHRQQDMAQLQPPCRVPFMGYRFATKVNADQAKQTAPEHHYHRQDRPQLDNNFEGFRLIAGKTQ